MSNQKVASGLPSKFFQARKVLIERQIGRGLTSGFLPVTRISQHWHEG
ncbi:MAG: hypothetical protein M3119_01685 [Verrucomicrobiota bacterium]|nr:hypothetical protein [Verrucomicrobiota bacterium]MDQ6938848.1 hypothetical protein [Verrucomicrobiota bacterium]